jgi:hypothetical protein
MIAEAVFEEAGAVAKAALVRKGYSFAQERVLPFVGRRLAQADAAGPSFSTGATVVIAGTTLVVGAVAGWKLCDLMRRKSR